MIPAGPPTSPLARWRRKFSDAFDGLFHGIRTESSLQVHFVFAIVVLIVAGVLAIEPWRWAVLLVYIALVISAEYFNSSIEQLVRAVNPGHNPEILITSLLAALIGLITLAIPLQESLGF